MRVQRVAQTVAASCPFRCLHWVSLWHGKVVPGSLFERRTLAENGSGLGMANEWLSLASPPFSFTQWIAVFFPPELSLHINTALTVSQGRGLAGGRGRGAVE